MTAEYGCRSLFSQQLLMSSLSRLLVAAMATLLSATSPGVALGQQCRTSSDFEITLSEAALTFERRNAPTQRIEMRSGALAVNQQPLKLSVDDRKRIAAFETRTRELIPKIKTIGQ